MLVFFFSLLRLASSIFDFKYRWYMDREAQQVHWIKENNSSNDQKLLNCIRLIGRCKPHFISAVGLLTVLKYVGVYKGCMCISIILVSRTTFYNMKRYTHHLTYTLSLGFVCLLADSDPWNSSPLWSIVFLRFKTLSLMLKILWFWD